MSQFKKPVFETERLIIRPATEGDIETFYALWTNPEVMKNVGFPQGIPITLEEMKKKPFEPGETEFDQLLVIERKDTGQAIGECKLSQPNDEGDLEPDIKLLPEHWGFGYGSEAWSAMIAYLFNNTDCVAIMTTPNVNNRAAIKMYESSGAIREGEDVYNFPESMHDYTSPVHCFIYRLTRDNWTKTN